MIFKREENIKSLLFVNKFKQSINGRFTMNFTKFVSDVESHWIVFAHKLTRTDTIIWFEYLVICPPTFSSYIFMRGDRYNPLVIKKV